jgi:hypothetical protein
MTRTTGKPAAVAGNRPVPAPAAAPKPSPSFDIDVDVDVVPQEEMTPPPRTESAEMLVDLPPEELKGQRPQNQAKPKSGVYDVKPVAVAEESSQPEVVAEQTQKKRRDEDEIGMAKTLPAVEMTDEERAELRAKVRAARASEASEPDLVFEAAAPDESKPVVDLVRPGKATQSGTTPLSEMLTGEPKSAWYTNTWVIVTMAVVAAAAIAGTVLLVTCAG